MTALKETKRCDLNLQLFFISEDIEKFSILKILIIF